MANAPMVVIAEEWPEALSAAEYRRAIKRAHKRTRRWWPWKRQ